jgi:hypothetical protein
VVNGLRSSGEGNPRKREGGFCGVEIGFYREEARRVWLGWVCGLWTSPAQLISCVFLKVVILKF